MAIITEPWSKGEAKPLRLGLHQLSSLLYLDLRILSAMEAVISCKWWSGNSNLKSHERMEHSIKQNNGGNYWCERREGAKKLLSRNKFKTVLVWGQPVERLVWCVLTSRKTHGRTRCITGDNPMKEMATRGRKMMFAIDAKRMWDYLDVPRI